MGVSRRELADAMGYKSGDSILSVEHAQATFIDLILVARMCKFLELPMEQILKPLEDMRVI